MYLAALEKIQQQQEMISAEHVKSKGYEASQLFRPFKQTSWRVPSIQTSRPGSSRSGRSAP